MVYVSNVSVNSFVIQSFNVMSNNLNNNNVRGFKFINLLIYLYSSIILYLLSMCMPNRTTQNTITTVLFVFNFGHIYSFWLDLSLLLIRRRCSDFLGFYLWPTFLTQFKLVVKSFCYPWCQFLLNRPTSNLLLLLN